MTENKVKLEFDARSENESLARVTIAAFLTPLNPTLEEINNVKTAVSEAVTNAILHGYEEKEGTVSIQAELRVESEPEKGTRIHMQKKIGSSAWIADGE